MTVLIKKRQSLLPGDTGKFAGIVSGFILLLAVLPILTMIVMSFSGASNLDFPPSSYSLQWYKAAWQTFVSPDASDVLSLGQAMDILHGPDGVLGLQQRVTLFQA